jgi:GWxTD domain-containing protein
MKRLIFLLFLYFQVFHRLIVAQVDAIFEHKLFMSSEGPYLETYIYLYANTLRYLPNEAQVPKCAIEVTQILKLKGEIVDFKKYQLINPEQSVDEVYDDLVDVKRFLVKNNEQYELEVSIKDLNNPQAQEQQITKLLDVTFREDYVELSDIQLVSSYRTATSETILSKSGMELVPMVGDFYPQDFTRIMYYFEVYNARKTFGEEGKYVITHFLSNARTGKVAGVYSKTVRGKAEDVIPIFYYFDIQSLPTGSYFVVAQIRDQQNELIIERKIPFARVNNAMDMNLAFMKDVDYRNTFVDRMPVDSLTEFIYCLAPITGGMENRMLVNQVKGFDEEQKRQFIYSFWMNRNPENPELAWIKYHEQVLLVDQMFASRVRRGYETDRGRIYLKYGPPNNVEDRPNEPSTYPYQIWHYYKIGQFNNKRFIFYLPDLVTNDYVVLHSDLQGEIQNFKWERDLNKRNTPTGNIDDANEGNFNSWGNNSNVLFRNP